MGALGIPLLSFQLLIRRQYAPQDCFDFNKTIVSICTFLRQILSEQRHKAANLASVGANPPAVLGSGFRRFDGTLREQQKFPSMYFQCIAFPVAPRKCLNFQVKVLCLGINGTRLGCELCRRLCHSPRFSPHGQNIDGFPFRLRASGHKLPTRE
jgi:hypothetical protein